MLYAYFNRCHILNGVNSYLFSTCSNENGFIHIEYRIPSRILL